MRSACAICARVFSDKNGRRACSSWMRAASVPEGGLSRLFEQDTLLVLLILYVLLKDETGGIDRDLLLLAGIFLLIGL